MNRSALERAPDKPPAPELDGRGCAACPGFASQAPCLGEASRADTVLLSCREAAAKAASHPQHDATAAQPPRGAGGEDSKGGEPAGPAEPGLPPLPRPAKTRADKASCFVPDYKEVAAGPGHMLQVFIDVYCEIYHHLLLLRAAPLRSKVAMAGGGQAGSGAGCGGEAGEGEGRGADVGCGAPAGGAAGAAGLHGPATGGLRPRQPPGRQHLQVRTRPGCSLQELGVWTTEILLAAEYVTSAVL